MQLIHVTIGKAKIPAAALASGVLFGVKQGASRELRGFPSGQMELWLNRL